MGIIPDIRRYAEMLYNGHCTVTVYGAKKDPLHPSIVLGFEEKTLFSDIPCRLSYGGQAAAAMDLEKGATSITQEIQLFLSPEFEVPEGCKIVVTQNGQTVAYKRSGPRAVYTSHQEIDLELFRAWA